MTAETMSTQPSPASPEAALAAFLARFDAFIAATKWPEVRLSRALFADDDRVHEIRRSASDVGIKRLARADAQLAALATEAGVTLPLGAAGNESDVEAERPLQSGECR